MDVPKHLDCLDVRLVWADVKELDLVRVHRKRLARHPDVLIAPCTYFQAARAARGPAPSPCPAASSLGRGTGHSSHGVARNFE